MKTVKSSTKLAMDDAPAKAARVTMDLHSFVQKHDGYKYGPLIVCAVLAATWHVPVIANFYESRNLAGGSFLFENKDPNTDRSATPLQGGILVHTRGLGSW
jgi:hypothetical protein